MNKRLLLLLLPALVLIVFASVANPVSAELPTRFTPTPMHKIGNSALRGAHIILKTAVSVWTVVQWQDANGDWHDVDGWRGSAAGGVVEWWVAPKDFSTGPFRWVVYPTADGEMIAVSEPFYLPDVPDGRLTVTIDWSANQF